MHKIAKFEKVTRERFVKDIMEEYPGICQTVAEETYAELKRPRRATIGSAGYDFYTPVSIHLKPGETAKIPTGIRARMDLDWVLMIFPRSGLGFKFRLQLDNTTGVIDADYYGSDNEGHIFIKITNDGRKGKDVILNPGDAFAQGVFLPYGITEDDDADGVRNGGMGSTDQNKK